jgi:hypothetical protein
MSVALNRRQLNAALTLETFDRVARAARKLEVSRSRYLSMFVEENIDVIDPEGAPATDGAA